jgi:hypothetical protein
MSLQPFAFTYAQNLTKSVQTNTSDSQYYIPPTISKEAQEISDLAISKTSDFLEEYLGY